MYTGRGFEVSELGDIDLFLHNGLYHLFHLILPNHDYIAHAVSRDGFLWRRVRNALFIGEPGDWDDDMIWTMNITNDPDDVGTFRMFYTGLSRKEGGRIQRIGLARSNDLYHWEKVRHDKYPISITGPHYEASIDEGRHWVSCRDPFFYHEGDTRLLLVNARAADGPLVRRGCVGVARETEPDRFVWEAPLYYPRMYDDIEVPGLFTLQDRYYLIGNIKEDIKIHYWQSANLTGPYEAYASNVLLPQGNYAARVIKDQDHILLWNFFTNRSEVRRTTILPPPTEIRCEEDGQLYMTSYLKFNEKVQELYQAQSLVPLHQLLANPTASATHENGGMRLISESGYEIFLLSQHCANFRLRFSVALDGVGKMGVVFRSDLEANAHYISLDMIHGFAQARVWGVKSDGGIEDSFYYAVVQDNKFEPRKREYRQIEVVAFGGYIELSVNSRVVLRYVETSYINQEHIGFYVESAQLHITGFQLESLNGPEEEDHQLF